MGNVSPGVLADATRVANLLRRGFDGWPKAVGKRQLLRSMVRVKPRLMLDLWGGGASAEEALAAGIPVLSVDDGRAFGDRGITKARGRRALEVTGATRGYRTGWGPLLKFVAECDAAFLDFCGHWCPEVSEILRACRHMRAIGVTLMPERVPIGERLGIDEWEVAYRALLENATGLVVRWSYRYQRESGRWAIVFFLTSRQTRRVAIPKPTCIDCGATRSAKARKYCAECRDKRDRAARRTWEAAHRAERAAYKSEYQRQWVAKHPERVKEHKAADYRRHGEAQRAKQRERYVPKPKALKSCAYCGAMFASQYPNTKLCEQHRHDGSVYRAIEAGRVLLPAVSGTAGEAVLSEAA